MSKVSFNNQLIDKASLVSMIEAGDFLVIAADESILKDLPSGNWIAGSIPYFMADEGGLVSKEKIFVNKVEGFSPSQPPRITMYDAKSISRIAQDAPENGFTITILPAMSEVHTTYAEKAPEFPNMFFTPILGWISGFHLGDEGASAKTGFGPGNMLMDQQAVAMHVTIPDNQVANINIINLFEEGDGQEIKFTETGFKAGNAVIDGVETNLAQYIKDNNIDTRLPLVADYSGVKVNVSIQNVNDQDVDFYAPVFTDMSYHFAKPVADYVAQFEKEISDNKTSDVAFSCNCILNFLYSELEGKKTANMTGPITFGEVAFQLLNQTMVYMNLSDA